MEGLTNHQDVANYKLLAKYYDYLLSDKDSFSYWLKYIEEKPFKSCLELASGSAIITGILKDKGYNIIASDISPEMKECSKNNFDGEYLILDMTNYKLDKKFDLIICLCDSINYLDYDGLNNFIKCAYNHLNDNGRLIFDTHNIERLNEFNNEYVEEGKLDDGNFYQWTIMADKLDMKIHENFTFYIKNDIIQEHHVQSVFEKERIIELMKNNNFNCRYINNFIENEKDLVIGEKL